MKRVGFTPAPLAPAHAGTGRANEPLVDAEPAAVAESEPDAEPDKKTAGRKSRRKADEG